jgi:hypothetical protein
MRAVSSPRRCLLRVYAAPLHFVGCCEFFEVLSLEHFGKYKPPRSLILKIISLCYYQFFFFCPRAGPVILESILPIHILKRAMR